jgi:hypothetical protein
VRQRIVLFSLVVLAALVVGWNVWKFGGYYYGLLAHLYPSAPAESSYVSGMSPQPTERSSSASVMPTEETTTLEETTTFQVAEGTRTSSTVRIVCLRADQGASPPTQSTEALNRGVLTRVLTPKVAAHPDGVHYRIDNRLGKATTYTSDLHGSPSLKCPSPRV